MKLSSQRALIGAVLASAFVGVSATALAQGMGAMPHGMSHRQHMQQGASAAAEASTALDTSSMAQRHAQRMEHLEKMLAEHQARLKADLKLTPAQEPAWLAYRARTGPQARPVTPAADPDGTRLTTPQRLDKMQALHKARQAERARRIDATKSFYAALTAEQQQVFDNQGPLQRTGMRGGHGSYPDMRHGGGQHGSHRRDGMGCEAMAKPQG